MPVKYRTQAADIELVCSACIHSRTTGVLRQSLTCTAGYCIRFRPSASVSQLQLGFALSSKRRRTERCRNVVCSQSPFAGDWAGTTYEDRLGPLVLMEMPVEDNVHAVVVHHLLHGLAHALGLLVMGGVCTGSRSATQWTASSCNSRPSQHAMVATDASDTLTAIGADKGKVHRCLQD